jgi:hypothetical protein
MADFVKPLVANKDLFTKLHKVFGHNGWPQTVLIAGVGEGEQLSMALNMAQAMLCVGASPPCHSCGPCLRVIRQASESLLVVRPERQQIRVEEAEKVRQFASLEAVGKQIIIIENVECMTAATANSLLKLLEEPPRNTYFLLSSENQAQVLRTVRSRAFTLRLRPRAVVEETGVSLKPKAQQLLSNWISDSAQFLVSDWREQLGNRSESLLLVETLIQVCLEQFKSTSEARWIKLAHDCSELQSQILAHMDPVLAFERLWIKQDLRLE